MFTYQWDHEGQVWTLAAFVDMFSDTIYRLVNKSVVIDVPKALALEFKHLVEENKRLQEGK